MGHLLGFNQFVFQDTHALSIYNGKMLSPKDLMMYSVEVILSNREGLALGNTRRSIENVAISNFVNSLTAHLFAAPSTVLFIVLASTFSMLILLTCSATHTSSDLAQF
jgi:hypothetical protein